MESAEPLIEFEPLTDVECKKAGLSPDPSYEEFLNGEAHSSPERLEELIRVLPEEHRPRLHAELEASRKHHEAVAAWDAEFEDFLELPKGRLFVALREGRVKAAGLPIVGNDRQEFPDGASDEDWQQWCEAPWQEIPRTAWTFTGVSWKRCRIDGKQQDFALTLVSTYDLLREFPLPAADVRATAAEVGAFYVLVDGGEVTQHNRRGRPAHDWQSFHVEMARRIRKEALPSKQEALIAEMQEWCQRHWNCRVARSTLLPKIAPYYGMLQRQSENG